MHSPVAESSPPALSHLGSGPPGLHGRGQQAHGMALAHAAAHSCPLRPALPAGSQQLAAVVLLSQGKACRLVRLLPNSQAPRSEAAPQQDELVLNRAAQLRSPLVPALCGRHPPAGQLSPQVVPPCSLLRRINMQDGRCWHIEPAACTAARLHPTDVLQAAEHSQPILLLTLASRRSCRCAQYCCHATKASRWLPIICSSRRSCRAACLGSTQECM